MQNHHPTVDDVRNFWNSNPLFTGEIKNAPVGTEQWFDEMDRLEIQDGYVGDISWLAHKGLEGKKVLEVGCGPGFLSRQMGRLNLDYTAVDLAPRSIELASKGQKLRGLPGKFQVGNAEALDFADETFDHVVSIGVIHHTPNTEKCVEEIYRVLKKGGTGTVGLYYKNFLLENKPALSLALKAMGVFKLGLNGRGREKMAGAGSVDELVRMYDGSENPVGKAYNKEEVHQMFSKFTDHKLKQFFFPARMLKVPVPKPVHRLLADHLGLMIAISFRKP